MRLFLLSIVAVCSICSAFVVVPTLIRPAAAMGRRPLSTLLGALKPTFNAKTQQWERAKDDDGKYPYDAVGALLRHGPSPFITRIVNAKEYEQMILKYMAAVGVTRAEATGNMDAKLNNGIDWAFQKMEEKKGASKVDYTRLDEKQALLVIVWAVFITPLAINVVYQTFVQASSHPHPLYHP